jgi:hypothetical protein
MQTACGSPIEQLESRFLLSTTPYTFQNFSIGGGGFVTGIFYDPHNQNVMYARTDVGGLFKSVNDGGKWTQLLNWVGAPSGVLSFAMDPENSNNLYADCGLYQGTDGEVLYSTNAGATWNTTPLSFWVGGNTNGRGAGERIAVDPYDSNIVLLGSNDSGLWESTNAGHSFSQVASFSTSASINLVLFDPNGGTAGDPTQEIFVGENSTASGTNLYETTNGGSSWTEVTGTGTVPNIFEPNRAVMASDGNLYVAYADSQAPHEPDNGGIFRFNTSTGVWANVSPVIPQGTNNPYDYFGYCGIALDPNSPTTLVVTSLDRYNYDDEIWRTTNANASSPSWTTLYEDYQYQSYNPTRNTTNAPWAAGNSDGINNWACTVAIDPFNSAQIMYGTGGGIFATNNGNTTSTLTAPNSWYFPDNGLEMTAILSLGASTGGTPLYSGLGDLGGFANTTLSYSPEQGNYKGSNGTSVDYAGLAGNDFIAVGNWGGTNGIYSTNGGVTYTSFSASPSGASAGTAAMSANGSIIVWAPSGEGPYYSTNNGSSWTATNLVASVTSITQSGGVPTVVTSSANNFAVGQSITISGASPSAYNGTYAIASIVNSTTFTYTDSNVTSSTASGTGTITASLNGTVLSDKVNPNYCYFWTENNTDNSWTLYISSNGGETFSPSTGGSVGTGNVEVVVNPTVAGQLWITGYVGLYESTNFGASFSHVGSYSINAPGIAVGAPAPGSAYPAVYIYGTLSSGGFDGVYRSDDGANSWLQLNTASQGVGSSVMAADPYVFGRFYAAGSMGNPATSLPTGWSDTDINEPGNPGWATSSTTLSTGSTVNQWNVVGGGADLDATSVPISSLTVSGDVATAVSTVANGFQVGQTVTISGATNSVYDGTFVITGLGNTAAGLADDIGAATEFTFALNTADGTASGTIEATLADQFNFAYEPAVANAEISAQLLGLTNADAGAATPQAGVMFRAAANPGDQFISLTQTASGVLDLQYRTTIDGAVTTQTLTGVPVGAEYVELLRTNGNTFTAYYGTNGTNWTQLGSPITINGLPPTVNAGLAATSNFNPQLTDATFSNVKVVTSDSPPTLVTPAAASASTVTSATVNLSVLGGDASGQANLTYTWATTGTPPATVAFSPNATNAAQNTIATFTQPGSYSFIVTISNTLGQSVTSTVSVTVVRTFASITVTPAAPTVAAASTTQFSAVGYDQFNIALVAQPNFQWTVSSGSGSIDNTGLFTAPSSGGTATVQASTGTVAGSTTVTISPALGIFTNDADIGSPSPTGSASYAASTGTYTVTGGGADIWNSSDQFNYLYKSYSGNGTIIARVTSVGSANTWSKAAVMFRNSTAAGAAFVDVVVSYSSGVALQYRTSTNGSANEGTVQSAAAPSWIELVRSGTSDTTFTGYYSTSTAFPTSWTSLGSITVSNSNLATSALAGLAVTSHDDGTTCTGTFVSTQITGTDQTPAVSIGAAAASPTITAGGSSNLSVLGVDDAGASTLTYTWAATPSTGVTYSANGTNAADATTATFTNPGLYNLVVTIRNGSSQTTTSTVNVNVLPTWLSATSVAIWNATTSTLSVAGAATITADPGTAEPIINASGASAVLTINPGSGQDVHLGGLTLTDGASAALTSLGSARSVTNYRLLVIGTTAATVAPTYTIDTTSTLDLADNDMAILYGSGSTPLSTVNAQLLAAYDGGRWDKPGLTSSAAPTEGGNTALGFGEASTLGLSTFDGLSLGGNAVLVKYTVAGDVNLDGSVGLADYNAVLAHYNGTAQSWTNGSFDYSGTVGLAQYNLVLAHYNQTLAGFLPSGSSPALTSSATSTAATTTAATPTTTTITTSKSPSKKSTSPKPAHRGVRR